MSTAPKTLEAAPRVVVIRRPESRPEPRGDVERKLQDDVASWLRQRRRAR